MKRRRALASAWLAYFYARLACFALSLYAPRLHVSCLKLLSSLRERATASLPIKLPQKRKKAASARGSGGRGGGCEGWGGGRVEGSDVGLAHGLGELVR
jgi:hypothetical protein